MGDLSIDDNPLLKSLELLAGLTTAAQLDVSGERLIADLEGLRNLVPSPVHPQIKPRKFVGLSADGSPPGDRELEVGHESAAPASHRDAARSPELVQRRVRGAAARRHSWRSAARPAITCCWSTAGRRRRRSRRTPPTTPSTRCCAPTRPTASSSSPRSCRPTVAPSGVVRLVERLAHPTMCSIGIELPGVPSLVLDNRPGMEAVVEHLIRDHGCRKLAFLAGTPGNPEADVRFEAYQAVLSRHGIAFDPSLACARATSAPTRPRWRWRRSSRAAWQIDGVVAANDEMATGAIDLLRKRGLRVPAGHPRHRLRRSRPGAPGKPAADHRRAAVRSRWPTGRCGRSRSSWRGERCRPAPRSARGSSAVNRAGAATRPTGRIRPTLAAIISSAEVSLDRAPGGAPARAGRTSRRRLLGRRRGGDPPPRRASRRAAGRGRGLPAGDLRPAGQRRQRQRAAAAASQRDLLPARRAPRVVEPRRRARPLRRAEPGRALHHHQPDAAPPAARRELPAPARRRRTGVDRLRPGVAAGRAGQGPAQRRRPHGVSGLRGRRRQGGVAIGDVPAGRRAPGERRARTTPPASWCRRAR